MPNLNSLEGLKRFDEEMDKVESIRYGFKCHICGREITKAHNGENRGKGFMRISMIGHIKKHFRKGEVADA